MSEIFSALDQIHAYIGDESDWRRIKYELVRAVSPHARLLIKRTLPENAEIEKQLREAWSQKIGKQVFLTPTKYDS